MSLRSLIWMIGNCETMMELVNFVKRLSPSKAQGSGAQSLNKSSIVSNMTAGASSVVGNQFILSYKLS